MSKRLRVSLCIRGYCFWKKRALRAERHGPNMYVLTMIEPIHNLQLGISKMIKRYMEAYVSSKRLVTTVRDVVEGAGKTFAWASKAMLCECTALLSAIDWGSGKAALNVDFSKENVSLELYLLFLIY